MSPSNALCKLFQESVDYTTYLTKYGCEFDYFTCCSGVNTTILDTFAREACNTTSTDVCDQPPDIKLLVYICIGILMMAYLMHMASSKITGRRYSSAGGGAYYSV